MYLREKKKTSVILEALRNTLRATGLLGSDGHELGLLHFRALQPRVIPSMNELMDQWSRKSLFTEYTNLPQ